MKKENILYFDIETSHAIAAVYQLGKQYVGHTQVLKDRKILTIAYVWNNDKKPTVLTLNLNKHDITKFDDDADKEMLVRFMQQYSKADVVVAHNGRRFDIARLAGRLLQLNLPPITPMLIDDTYTMTKGLDVLSHKLDYLGRSLGLGQKIKVDIDLWIDIVWYKSKKALKQMATYNKNDVILLRKIYQTMLPYVKSNLNKSMFTVGDRCPRCKGKLRSKGYYRTQISEYRRYRCNNCHAYCRDPARLYSASKRLL